MCSLCGCRSEPTLRKVSCWPRCGHGDDGRDCGCDGHDCGGGDPADDAILELDLEVDLPLNEIL